MYHIIFRGINRQNLFEGENDFIKMREIISSVKEEKHFALYAYCFMTNHVHLFIKEAEQGDITKIMHKILTKYVGLQVGTCKWGRACFCTFPLEPVGDVQF